MQQIRKNYKMSRMHGYNPFEKKRQPFSLFSVQNNEQKAATQKPERVHDKKQSKRLTSTCFIENDKLMSREYEIRSELKDGEGRVYWISDKEFAMKRFDKIYNLSDKKSTLQALAANRGESQFSNQLYLYVANTSTHVDKFILGSLIENATSGKSQQGSPQKSQSSTEHQGLLHRLYESFELHRNKYQSEEERNNTILALSVLSVKDENTLYDELNTNWLQNDIDAENLQKQRPAIKITKKPAPRSSNSKDQPCLPTAENLNFRKIETKQNLNEVLQHYQKYRNYLSYYHNYSQKEPIGVFYQISELQIEPQKKRIKKMRRNVAVLQINQYVKEHSENDDARFDSKITIGRLIMRLGMCVKKNLSLQRPLKKHNERNLLYMHQSKILFYFSIFFINADTQFHIFSETGTCPQISEQMKNLSLVLDCQRIDYNKEVTVFPHSTTNSHRKKQINLKSQSFVHLGHYLNQRQILEKVKTLIDGQKFKEYQENHCLDSVKMQVSLRNSRKIMSANQKVSEPNFPVSKHSASQKGMSFEGKASVTPQKKQLSIRQTEKINPRSMSLYKKSEKVKSRSFYYPTISSYSRNYAKQISREFSESQRIHQAETERAENQPHKTSKIGSDQNNRHKCFSLKIDFTKGPTIQSRQREAHLKGKQGNLHSPKEQFESYLKGMKRKKQSIIKAYMQSSQKSKSNQND